jgi:hypothetical protein
MYGGDKDKKRQEGRRRRKGGKEGRVKGLMWEDGEGREGQE